jgi:starch synthase
MKILLVSSEVAPFAKTGGLADVAGALPKALKQMGHDVRIILPLYKTVERSEHALRKGRKSVEVQVGGVMQKGLLRQTYLDDIPVYFLENKEYFARDFLYGPPEGDYPDNDQRFAFFCRGVLQLVKRMDFRPDVIHCNDWQTALIPLLLKHELKEDLFFSKTAIIFTIHNLAYQGLFDKASLGNFGLDEGFFTIDRLEYYGKVNLMKGGILHADIINTVSETYCREIQTEQMGFGMDGILRQRAKDLHGIPNGIDYDEFDPVTDRAIAKNYTPSALAGKSANKKSLQKELGLPQNADAPLIGMVSRLSSQKGFDLMEKVLPKLVASEAQLAILGTGDATYIKLLQEFKRQGKNVAISIGFDPLLARRIYAGSDMFLMPSHYEPCGLGQLIALKYGSVPIVRKTGGLADTVVDLKENPKEATGFSFGDYEPDALWEAISRALEAYGTKEIWKKLMRKGMNTDFSWRHAAERYEDLYRKGVERKRS